MGSIEQLIRVGLYSLGGYVLGDGVANSAEYQAAIGGLIQVATFVWWVYRNRKAA